MSDTPRPSGPLPPAGWYPDTANPNRYRWWDGRTWTDIVQEVQSTPPPAAHAPTLIPPPAAHSYSATATAPSMATPYETPPAQFAQSQLSATARNPLATWALVLGILGMITIFMPFLGVVLGAVALVLGILGASKAKSVGRSPAAAIIGLVLGAIAVALGLAITVTILVLGARGADTAESSEPRALAPTVGATPVEPTPSETVEPTPAEPAPAAPPPTTDGDPNFVQLSRGDLADFSKDLNDMIVTIDEGGFWRLLGNSIELSFNYGQLSSRTPPASIAEEWNAQLPVLDEQITRIDDAIADDRTDDLRAIIAEAQNQVAVLNGILDRAGG